MKYESLYATALNKASHSEIGILKAKAEGDGFLSLAEGVPASELFPVEQIAKAAAAVWESAGREVLQYGDYQGYEPLREKITGIMKKFGVTFKASQIQLTSGSTQSMDLITRVFINPGDTVLTENPTYIDNRNILRFNGANIVGLPCDSEGIDIKALQAKLSSDPTIKLIYVIPDFQNPTGLCWSDKRRQEFMETVAPYDVIVVEDNPYGEITYTGQYHKALQAYDTKGQVIFLGSLSKTFSPGLRIGWLTGPQEIIDQACLVKEHCDLHSSIPDHALAAMFMDMFSYDDHVTAMCAEYMTRRDALMAAIDEYLPGCRYTKPNGGFFLWLHLPKGITAMKFFEACLTQKVMVIPGVPFYTDGRDEGTLRLNFTGLPPMTIKEAVIRMGRALEICIDNE